jgi:hypothetical protein
VPPLQQHLVKPGGGGDLAGECVGDGGKLAALGPQQVRRRLFGPVVSGA